MQPLVLRASGTDSNAGASGFVGFPVPLGLQNGDIAIVAIALPVGVTATPPDSTWTQIAQSDPAQFGIGAFWTTVLNAPANWVFSLSSAVVTTGALAVYGNADVFNPFDATAVSVSAVAGSIPAITAALNGDELATFLVGAGNGTFTPAANYQETAKKSAAGASISFQHKALQSAGVQATVSETFSVGAAGACITIAVAASYGSMTYDDAYQRVFEGMPPGVDNVLDFTPTGDFYKYFWVIGSIIKVGFDLLDIARQEIVPYLARYKLPDWERAFGLLGTLAAQTGTVPQRQAQVLGSWRAAAGQGASVPTVQAILGPLLGYSPTTAVQVVECERSALTLLHSYDIGSGGDISIPAGVTSLSIFVSGDGGKVAQMGAQLMLAFSVADTSLFAFTLTAPDGRTKTWSAGGLNAPLWLTTPSFAGAAILGTWKLDITNSSGGTVTLYTGSALFVEGIQRGQQTAGAVFEWGVYADPAHVGESSTPGNFAAARAAIQKLKFSHCIANLIQSLAPYPDVASGVNAAIPDECTPV